MQIHILVRRQERFDKEHEVSLAHNNPPHYHRDHPGIGKAGKGDQGVSIIQPTPSPYQGLQYINNLSF